MNKSELVAEMAQRAGVTQKDAAACLDAFLEIATEIVTNGGEKLSIPGYMTIEQTFRSARMARNPQTGEAIHVPATKSVKISAGATLKKAAAGRG